MVSLIFVVIYLLSIVSILGYALVMLLMGGLPENANFMKLALTCCDVAGFGGCLYCIRAVYINKCVCKRWDSDWVVWYLLRPIASVLSGGASYLFLKAGLLILESQEQSASSDIGFIALAFVAGLNVDKFLSKLENIAQAVWGIDKSRASSVEGDRGGKA